MVFGLGFLIQAATTIATVGIGWVVFQGAKGGGGRHVSRKGVEKAVRRQRKKNRNTLVQDWLTDKPDRRWMKSANAIGEWRAGRKEIKTQKDYIESIEEFIAGLAGAKINPTDPEMNFAFFWEPLMETIVNLNDKIDVLIDQDFVQENEELKLRVHELRDIVGRIAPHYRERRGSVELSDITFFKFDQSIDNVLAEIRNHLRGKKQWAA